MFDFSLAGDDGCFALTAGPAAAEIGCFDAGGFDGFEDTLVRRHIDHAVGPRQLHLEGLAGRRCQEFLGVQILRGPAVVARRIQHAADHARRAADIEVRAERLVAKNVIHRDEELFLIAVDLDAVRAVALLQRFPVGAVAAGADAVVELEGPALEFHLVHHGHERGDTNSARHHDVLLATVIKGKEIHRLAQDQRVAFFQRLMQKRRTTARFFDSQHTDFVATGISRCRHERVGVAA